MSAKSAFSIALFVILLIIAFQNMETTVIQVLFWGVTAPFLMILLSVFLMGLLVGMLLSHRKRGKQNPTGEAGSKRQEAGG